MNELSNKKGESAMKDSKVSKKKLEIVLFLAKQ